MISYYKTIPIDIKLLNAACMPTLGTNGSAGYDLRASLLDPYICIQPGEQIMVGAGFSMHIEDPNCVGILFPRSGLGCAGLVLGNGTGVIDSDYTGEIKLALWNRSKNIFHIEHLERVAQMLIVPVMRVEWRMADDHAESVRGPNGFGSTGVK